MKKMHWIDILKIEIERGILLSAIQIETKDVKKTLKKLNPEIYWKGEVYRGQFRAIKGGRSYASDI